MEMESSCTTCESVKEKRAMIVSMNSRCFVPMEAAVAPQLDNSRVVSRTRPHRRTSSVFIRLAMRVSRSKWFSFLRRVFRYQNGTSLSKAEKPFWPMRIWITGYEIGCFLSLLILYGRYKQLHIPQIDDSSIPIAVSRVSQLTSKCRTSLDLFFAIWFVMGNVWVFDSRIGSFNRAPKLHVLSLILLSWNAVCYSFPFLLFLLLCCFVPLVSTLLGYNMNMGSSEPGASDDQISTLSSWTYKSVTDDLESPNNPNSETECCICLARYKDEDEVRQLPCLHIFHLDCVDQWLRIISCCPLCKRQLQ